MSTRVVLGRRPKEPASTGSGIDTVAQRRGSDLGQALKRAKDFAFTLRGTRSTTSQTAQ